MGAFEVLWELPRIKHNCHSSLYLSTAGLPGWVGLGGFFAHLLVLIIVTKKPWGVRTFLFCLLQARHVGSYYVIMCYLMLDGLIDIFMLLNSSPYPACWTAPCPHNQNCTKLHWGVMPPPICVCYAYCAFLIVVSVSWFSRKFLKLLPLCVIFYG